MMLQQPVDLLPANEIGPVHFIAIGGAGMSAVAQLYHDLGVRVTGSDQSDSPALRHLQAQGIEAHLGHHPDHLGDARTVVVSTAIRENNPELVAARERGLRVWHRSTALAALMVGSQAVSVAGTHGKTTTTGMTAVMLEAAGGDPSYCIGAPLTTSGVSSHLGSGEAFVVEADESDGSFLQYPTRIAVITNVEADHLDNWETPSAYFDGFVRFATRESVQVVVINSDDQGAAELAQRLREGGSVLVSYGEADGSDVRLSDLDFENTASSARLEYGSDSGIIELQVPGRHNLANAAAGYTVGRLLGLDHEALLAGADEFGGTLRRFQLVADVQGVRIYDDYAHHPTEIRAALTAARRVAAHGRLVACFQPHLYSRTRDFADEFGEALALADVAIVTDIYAAREDPMPGVTGELVADAARRAGADTHYVADKTDLPAALAALLQPGDLVMTIGAGDVTLVGPLLASLLGPVAGR